LKSTVTRAMRYWASGILLYSAAASSIGQVLPDSVQACKLETDNLRRLECYDREAAKFPMTSKQRFGLSPVQVAAAQPQSPNNKSDPQSLSAQVSALRDRPDKGLVVTLDNGQIWVQYEHEAMQGIHVGDSVTLKPGMLGSFWLVGPTGWSTKVSRLQ
jgi:hypothetical protein